MVITVRDDLELALDRAAFAEKLGMVPDPWQVDLLRSSSERVLMNCCRQSGKSTMTGIIQSERQVFELAREHFGLNEKDGAT